jgi:hypothetical protein
VHIENDTLFNDQTASELSNVTVSRTVFRGPFAGSSHSMDRPEPPLTPPIR